MVTEIATAIKAISLGLSRSVSLRPRHLNSPTHEEGFHDFGRALLSDFSDVTMAYRV